MGVGGEGVDGEGGEGVSGVAGQKRMGGMGVNGEGSVWVGSGQGRLVGRVGLDRVRVGGEGRSG